MSRTAATNDSLWYLEGFLGPEKRLQQIPICNLPFRIGRQPGLELTLPSELVSSRHAQIEIEAGELRLTDLGSTNGTFVNRSRLRGTRPLEEGDVIHFANYEFRVGLQHAGEPSVLTGSTVAFDLDLPRDRVEESRRLRALLDQRAVISVFQPIVSLDRHKTIGYEALGRGAYDGLPTSIADLFEIASTIEAEAELSRAFRGHGCAQLCRALPGEGKLFINTHPRELGKPTLISSLEEFRGEVPEQELVLEIHERAISEPGAMRQLRRELEPLGIEIAYDDFGAGQSRLLELTEVPPEYLKFDRALVHGIARADEVRRHLLEGLVRVTRELGIATIAEGIERKADARVCRELGIDLAQGFLFGAPVSAASLPRSSAPSHSDS